MMSLKLQYRAVQDGLTYDGKPTWVVQYSVFGIFWKTISRGTYIKEPIRYKEKAGAVAQIQNIIKEKAEQRLRKYIG